MNIHKALGALGVRSETLSHAQKDQLDQEGFLPLPGILSSQQIVQMRAWLDQRLIEEGEQGGQELGYALDKNDGTLADLINKSALFDVCFTHPLVLAAMAHVLPGEFKLSSLNFRAPVPGHGLQELHADWDTPVAPGNYYACNSIWLLDEFTEQNGPTRVVPGSHLSGKMPREEMADPMQSHPDEVKLLAPAGTVIIFNAHTWHGGTRNGSQDRRRALHSYFCRRDQRQQIDQRAFIKPKTVARLSEAARYLLDVL